MKTLTWIDVFYCASFVALAAFVAWRLRLHLSGALAVAALRAVLQLSFVGLILAWIFGQQKWYQALSVVAAMTTIASFAAAARTPYAYKGLLWDVAVALAIGSCSVGFAAALLLQINPWYAPQFIVPIMGMILGNALTAVSLTARSLLPYLRERGSDINALLALSASPQEATAHALKTSVHNGITPTINSMTVVGVVSLPGMMTGQILAGSSPTQAIFYQLVVLFCICASGMLACAIVAKRIVARHFDAQWRLVVPQKQAARKAYFWCP